jgi:alpha-tubulin suppressor-like RCC1 family protein
VDVSAGLDHACAITRDGALACWGAETSTAPPDGVFTQVSAGNRYSCAVREDGAVLCWGNTSHGETEAPDGTFAQVGAGYFHACGLRTDGAIQCWGATPLPTDPYRIDFGQAQAPDGTFVVLSVGGFHNCALTALDEYVCWGDDTHRQSRPPVGFVLDVIGMGGSGCSFDRAGALSCWTSPELRAVPSGTRFASAAFSSTTLRRRASILPTHIESPT